MMSGDMFSIPSSIRTFAPDPDANPNNNLKPAPKKKRNLPGTPGKQACFLIF